LNNRTSSSMYYARLHRLSLLHCSYKWYIFLRRTVGNALLSNDVLSSYQTY